MLSLDVQNLVDAKVCLQFIILEQPENYNYMPRL